MFLCRVGWQRCGPLARKHLTRRVNLNRDVVPRRLMSSVPGGSGENWVYVTLCSGAFTGAIAYAYSTVSSDSVRYADRIKEIQSRPKKEWQPKHWPLTGGEEAEEVVEAGAEAVDAGLVELAAEINKNEAHSTETVVETVAEAVAEVVAEVTAVVEDTAEEVAEVAQELEEIAEKAENAAEAFEAPRLLAEETTGVEEPVTAAVEEPTAKSNVVAQENTELSAATVLEEPLMVCLGDVIPVKEPAVPLEDEPQEPKEPQITLHADEAQVTLSTKEATVATVSEESPVTIRTEEVTVVTVVEEAPVTLATVDDAFVVLGAEEASVIPATDKASVEPITPAAVEKVHIPLATEVIPIVLAEELPVVTEHLPAVHSPAMAEAPTPAETAVLPAGVEDPAPEPKPEYLVVVLEGGLKADKKPEVLGVSSVTGRIVPAHDDDDDDVSAEGNRANTTCLRCTY